MALSLVVELLVDHLTLGEVFRVTMASRSLREHLSAEVPTMLLKHRLALKRHPKPTMASVSERMRVSRRRCVECGQPTGCVPRVCSECSSDPDGYRAMVQRRDVMATYRATHRVLRPKNLLQRLQALPILKVSRTGGRVHWRREAEEILGREVLHLE